MSNDETFLRLALNEAELGLHEGGIPIGAVLVHEGRVIGRGHNRRVQNGSAILQCRKFPDGLRAKCARPDC